ncbi:glutathione peroxidase [Macrococcus hajekii]|uniref:Glutathione peroxidase n=1 Tax=Macrococcus hajekii TaxID=198482 RepID=A0A4R6BHV1_9STAP|nr:glutathione peroxidase [Macrococcus hajekii]TDM01174.1 glutathione peroxidase [Macrococcus hajekii]GGB11940.1 glutathione peroxidase homolog BsaA [Macrococcus hajekii]
MTIYEYQAKLNNGELYQLDRYKGQVVLIVNTASKCGFTKQFDGLEKIYQQYKEQGFVVLGFPCNQFGNQEPGTAEEAANECRLNYGVTFPMHEKVEVNGDQADPLFDYLKKETSGLLGSAIKWNFTKFLVDRNGQVVERFGPQKEPEKITKDIERYL